MLIFREKADKEGCNNREKKLLELAMASLPRVFFNNKEYVSLEILQTFLTNFYEAIKEKDTSYLDKQRGLRFERIVDIEEFVLSKDYMNQKKDIRKPLLKSLIDLWAPDNYYLEAVLTGGIGIGKNYFADMCLAYMVYNLSCWHNPQLEFGLAPGSSIIFIQQSKNEKLAKKVILAQFAMRLKLSPYFQKYFPFDPRIKSELQFPYNISFVPVGGSAMAALGMNVFGGCIDECNFMLRSKQSVHTQYTGEDEYDQAEMVYNALLRRIKARFMKLGKIPGKLLLISSKHYEDDFTSRKIKEAEDQLKAEGKTDTFIMNYSQWEALPEDRFSGVKFLVELGDESRRSRIIRFRNEAHDPESIVEIPIEYKPDFERDMEGSLRDLGGIAVGTTAPFIPYRELIAKAVEVHKETFQGRSLFKLDKIRLSVENSQISSWDDWGELIDDSYIEDCLLNESSIFAVHIDVGLNKNDGDAAGLAIGHIHGYKQLPDYKYWSQKKSDFVEVSDIRVPIYCIDGALQVIASPGDEIDLNNLCNLVLYIRQFLNLKWATMDTYQSRFLMQAFKKIGLRSGILSVDTSIAPYTEVKLSIKDERILLPGNPVLAKELREIEKVKGKDRVDHPQNGTKDVSDGVAGVVYILQTKEAQYESDRRNRKSLQGIQQKISPRRRIHSGTIR